MVDFNRAKAAMTAKLEGSPALHAGYEAILHALDIHLRQRTRREAVRRVDDLARGFKEQVHESDVGLIPSHRYKECRGDRGAVNRECAESRGQGTSQYICIRTSMRGGG